MERDPGQDPDLCLQGIFFPLGDFVCFSNAGLQVAGQSGQSGACVTKRGSSTAAGTARCTARTLLSVSGTARSTKIASIMKSRVRTVSLRREAEGGPVQESSSCPDCPTRLRFSPLQTGFGCF